MTRIILQLILLLILPILLNGQMPEIKSIQVLETTIGQYEKFELSVDLDASFSNPYDYDEIVVQAIFTAPDGGELTVDGFFMKDFQLNTMSGALNLEPNGVFKIRLAPHLTGTWSYILQITHSSGTLSLEPETFDCVARDHPGFVRSNLTNYLHFDNGEQYIPVGENMAWQNSNAYLDYTKWLTGLSDNGGNFIRLWQAAWGLGVEWKNGSNGFAGLRRYKESTMAYQDWLFDFCADKGVYIMLCLQYHGQVSTQVNPNWQDSPYNVVNGGPCQNTWDFFTNEEARAHTKNRLRYIVARWGYARSIMAWELFNEVGWTDNYQQHQLEIADWHAEMAAYLKSIDPYQHLVTTSFADEAQDPLVWANPDIDLTQTHYYLNTSNLQKALVNGITGYLEAFGKPTLTGEFGLGGNSELANEDPDGIHIHNAMWGTLFGGGLGTGMSWWWDSYIEPQDLYFHFAPLSAVAAEIPFLAEDLRPASAFVSGASGDLLLTPTLGWAGIGEDTITIDEKGSTFPAGADLGIFLYGSQWNTNLRSPPTFVTHYPEAGTFSVKTNAETGTNPRLAIWVNGVKVLDEAAATNQTFTIPLSAGPQIITVDNTGTDWITIAAYAFSGLGSKVDAYVLRSTESTLAAGWVLNKDYNHLSVQDIGEPDPAVGGVLQVEDFTDGGYTVFWYDCLSGAVQTTETVFAQNGILEIPIPPLSWDLAFYVESNPLGFRKPELALDFEVYPNPLKAGEKLKVQLPGTRVGGATALAWYDAQGKPLNRVEGEFGASTLEMNVPGDLPAGMYWLQVQEAGMTGSRPVIIVE